MWDTRYGDTSYKHICTYTVWYNVCIGSVSYTVCICTVSYTVCICTVSYTVCTYLKYQGFAYTIRLYCLFTY